MRRRVAFIIDGHYMRRTLFDKRGKVQFYFCPKNIRKYCIKHLKNFEQLFRIYFYDAEPFSDSIQNPLSDEKIDCEKTKLFKNRTKFLSQIKNTPSFALRLGSPKYHKQWNLKRSFLNQVIKEKKEFKLEAKDIGPHFEQKMVDIKIGLDIALISIKKMSERIVIIAGDQDFVPALKLARREGMIVTLDDLGGRSSNLLKEHCDSYEYINQSTFNK